MIQFPLIVPYLQPEVLQDRKGHFYFVCVDGRINPTLGLLNGDSIINLLINYRLATEKVSRLLLLQQNSSDYKLCSQLGARQC
jgi:hypothetical protein